MNENILKVNDLTKRFGGLMAVGGLSFEIGTTETNDWLAAQGVTSGRVKSLTQMPGNLLLDGLRDGQGIVAATRAFIEPDLARGDVVVLFEDDDRGYGYFLLHRPETLRLPAKAFANWLRRQARNAV